MEKVADKSSLHPIPGAEGWDPWDEYDCRDNEPKQTQAYIDETRPAGVKEAIAKRQAEKRSAPLPSIPKKAEPKTS